VAERRQFLLPHHQLRVTQREPTLPHGPGRCRTQETNSEFKAYLELLWQVGGAQTDVAQLTAEDIDWQHRLVVYVRGKTGTVSRLQFGEGLAKLLQTLPSEGPLFPRLATLDQKRRGEMFLCRCRRLNIVGVTLHSYRYAWAERARIAG